MKVKELDHIMHLNWEKYSGSSFLTWGRYRAPNIICCYSSPKWNHRHLPEIAKCLMFHSEVPSIYRGECILTATHLINVILSKVLKGKKPFALLFGEEPKYENLRCFGCLCYASSLAQHRGMFDHELQVVYFSDIYKIKKVTRFSTRKLRNYLFLEMYSFCDEFS